jgi:predicted GNAT superfamily acetyltransferase
VAGIEKAGEKRPALMDSIVIRRCKGVPQPSPSGQGANEMQMCVELQKEVWGFSDVELVPLRLFVVAEKIGGQVIGCFDGSDMVGFAMSIPGIRRGRPYLHSHMLAVREGFRDKGLGRAIKLFQRDDALSHGIDLIEWTFDPLEIKNAYLNLEKLGAIARRYNVNQYGITTSPLQGGLPTDRLVAEWWLNSDRVKKTIDAGMHPAVEAELTVSIPAEVYEWKASPEARPKAVELQTRVREQLVRAFAEGLACLGYELDEQGNGKFLVGKWEEAAQ